MLQSSTTFTTTLVGAPVVQWPAEYVSIHMYNLYFDDILQEWEAKNMDKIVSRQTFSLIKRDKWLLYSMCDTVKTMNL